MKNPTLQNEAECMRLVAGMSTGPKLYFASANPEDEPLCLEIQKILWGRAGATSLPGAETRELVGEEALEWNAAMFAIADTLIVVSTSCPSVAAQAEILAALAAAKKVRIFLPWAEEFPAETRYLMGLLGAFETLRWPRHEPTASAAIAISNEITPRDLWCPIGYLKP